jgi:feruloyl-CoA synthase
MTGAHMTRAPTLYGPSDIRTVRRPDGAIIVTAPHGYGSHPRAMTDHLDRWAAETPDAVFLAQRDAKGDWQRITYSGARALVRNAAQALLSRNLSAERPIAMLSGNSLEQAILGLAANYIGIPFAPVSPAYSLISGDHGKLKEILGRLTPGLVFAINGKAFAKGIAAAVPAECELVVLEAPPEGRQATPMSALWETPATSAVDAANARIGPETIAKFLFTSGSTGTPKGVINTQRMLTANQAMMATSFPCLARDKPVLIDWLPWSHTFGGNHNFGLVLSQGGTLYIDDGKPMPGAIDETIRNLREIAPTIYFNVPRGFEMLLDALRADAGLRKTLFSRLQFLFYAGAALPPAVARELETMAMETRGTPLAMVTSLGATETAPAALAVTEKAIGPGVIGVPMAGCEMKLVPNAGKLECRLKGPNITPGYWRQPEVSAKAFDEEGYYLIGDALKFADPNDPEKGFLFDGRIAEDFKLKTGTWVSVGPLRARFLTHFAPLARDVVIGGHDRDAIGVLVIPELEHCRALSPALDKAAPPAAIIADPVVKEKLSSLLKTFNKDAGGSSNRILRLMLMETPPSIDIGEVTDKGSINQRAVLANRANLVAELFAAVPSARVVAA